MANNPGRVYAIGQAFKFKGKGLAFQNFHVGGIVRIGNKNHQFLPFGFSGVTVTRNGDNVDSSIVLPNNQLSRDFAVQALEEEWLTEVTIGSFDPGAPKKVEKVLYTYLGVVSAGGWDDTTINMTLNSVLDAVTGEIPHRILERDNVGPLPITANIRLQ